MQTKSEPPDGSPTAAIRNVQFSVSKGAAHRPDAAPRIPRREVNLNFERDGLLGGDGGLFTEELFEKVDYRAEGSGDNPEKNLEEAVLFLNRYGEIG